MNFLFSLIAMTLTVIAAETAPKPPVAKVQPKEIVTHGQKRVDNYFWLRDRNDPDTIAYLEAENRYTEVMMKHTDALQSKLYQEILGRIKEDDLSVPNRRGDFFYYSRTEKGKQYPIFCRKKGSLNAPEEILLDANALAEGTKYFQIGNFSVSPNHKLLAYSTDTTGNEDFRIFVKNLETGQLLPDQIEKTYYSLEWANDNQTFFYTTIDSAHRPFKVWRHRLGQPKDELVYHETDERFTVSLGKGRNDRFLYIGLSSSLTDETLFLDANKPEGKFEPVLPRKQGIEYSVEDHGDFFYVRINDTARNFRVVKMPVADRAPAKWQEILPARTGVTIESLESFANHLIVYERDHGLHKFRVEDLRNNKVHYVSFPEPVYSAFPGANLEWNTNLFRFSYTSLTAPTAVYDYNMDTRERELKKEQEIPSGYDRTQYVSERLFATAPDGVKVPISLVYKKGFQRNGKAPALLNGYGSYGAPSDPAFSPSRLSLLDRGFVFAIAHIRGGGDLGKQWHDDGKLMKKRNTFTDFIACAEHLVKDKYTSPDRLAITGGSAGGLLMGAVVNMRPDLFGVVVAKVPFVDVINTITDPSLPLTVGEWEEWGNPLESKEAFEYMMSYSPYDNVPKDKVYPQMLVTAGLNDPRVSYWEPAKWVAKTRALQKNGKRLLLKTNMGAGHFGASGRYEQIKETAFDYAFILDSLGIKE
jgi:oligopeptidase B